MRYLGKNPSSGQHDRIKKLILMNNIDTSHFTGQGWNKGSINYKTDEIFAEGSKAPRGRVRTFVIRDHLIPYECAICGNIGEWQGSPMALELDHINGVPNDHRLENLRFLCPNCHAITDTYCGKNKKNEKYYPHMSGKPIGEMEAVDKPSAEEIGSLAITMNKSEIARHYGVSATTIEGWCRGYGIPHTIKELRQWGEEHCSLPKE